VGLPKERPAVMKLQSKHLDIDIVELTRRRRGFRGGPGFYWHDVHLPPVGPFRSPADALRNIVNRMESGELEAAIEAINRTRASPDA